MIVRSFSERAVNDNVSAFTVTEITMVGFAVSLLIGIVVGTLIVCGVIA